MTTSPRTPLWTLLFALAFPTLVTWAYFVWLAEANSTLAQAAYAVGKVLQFGFPLAWLLLVERRKLRLEPPSGKGIGWGLLFGVLAAAAMMLLYWQGLKPAGLFEKAETAAQAKIEQLGLDNLYKYIAVGVFYSLAHSFLEEYYWRWFVFGRLRDWMTPTAAVVVSSLGFMSHHVLVLAQYFGWNSPTTYLFSLGVAVGGGVWAWIYHTSKSLYGPWLSHLLIDAAIFVIGYDLIWG